MSYHLRNAFVFVCIATSTMTEASINNWSTEVTTALQAPLEVIKATGIGQKQLGYSNNISQLVRNGNKWLLAMALRLKYGYNPLEGDTTLTTLDGMDAASALKDLTYYLFVAQEAAAHIAIEQQKKETYNQNMIIEGSVLTGATLVGLKLAYKLPIASLKLAASLSLLYTGITGGKKAFDGFCYPEYLQTKVLHNAIIQKTLMKAVKQLGQNAPASAMETLKQIESMGGKAVEKIKESMTGKKK